MPEGLFGAGVMHRWSFQLAKLKEKTADEELEILCVLNGVGGPDRVPWSLMWAKGE